MSTLCNEGAHTASRSIASRRCGNPEQHPDRPCILACSAPNGGRCCASLSKAARVCCTNVVAALHGVVQKSLAMLLEYRLDDQPAHLTTEIVANIRKLPQRVSRIGWGRLPAWLRASRWAAIVTASCIVSCCGSTRSLARSGRALDVAEDAVQGRDGHGAREVAVRGGDSEVAQTRRQSAKRAAQLAKFNLERGVPNEGIPNTCAAASSAPTPPGTRHAGRSGLAHAARDDAAAHAFCSAADGVHQRSSRPSVGLADGVPVEFRATLDAGKLPARIQATTVMRTGLTRSSSSRRRSAGAKRALEDRHAVDRYWHQVRNPIAQVALCNSGYAHLQSCSCQRLFPRPGGLPNFPPYSHALQGRPLQIQNHAESAGQTRL